MAGPSTSVNEHTTQQTGGQQMKAIVQREYGTADTWNLDEIERPAIGAGEVLVKVRAAGLDRGTWHLMAGLPYAVRLGFGFRSPKHPVPGRDLAGTVVSVGSKVTRLKVGDEVFGIGDGAFAEFAVAREDKLAVKPANLSFESAAAVPISGCTALRALTDVGRVEAGQRVLVIGASGGVGSYAVQIAAALGAQVTAVCSAAKSDLVRSLGASHVLDYGRDDFADGTASYDLILDIAGNSPISRLRRALASRGTLVIVGGEGRGKLTGGMDRQLKALAISPFVRQRLTMAVPKEHYSIVERLAQLIEDGSVVPSVDRTYPLSDAATAMRQLVAGQARGKLVITI